MSVIIGSRNQSKIFSVVAVVCSVAVIAFAVCCVIETDSADENVSASKAYVSVTESNKTESRKAEEKQEEISEKNEAENTSERIVYITKTGTKYHYSYYCSDSDFYECTLEEALERGLEPCSKCVE